MMTRENKIRLGEDSAIEGMMNYRLRQTARRIELELQKEIKQKKSNLDPYFDSIKNWRPI
jgi:hypothetical protein